MTDHPHPKVLLFTDSDVFAGTERHILDLAIGLRELGVQVAVACPSPAKLADRIAREGIEHIVIQKGGTWDRAAVRTLQELLQTARVDVIHAHNGRTALSAALALRGAKKGRGVATHHFIHPHHAAQRGIKGMLYRRVHRWVNRQIHAHIAISHAVREAMLARGEAPTDRIHLIHNGIAEPAALAQIPPAQVRAHYQVAPDTPLIVCTARLEVEKGIEHLIRAMGKVNERIPSAVCIIGGAGALRGEFEQLISSMRLEQAVRLAGFVEDPMSLVGAADLFVLPSLEEPFGLAIAEAMAMSKPVIATRAGGPMEIIEEGQTGLLAEAANAHDLARGILDLLTDRERARSMGIKGRYRFEERFTRDRMAGEILRVYRAVARLE